MARGTPPVALLVPAELHQLVENARDVVLVTEAEPLDEPGPRIVDANRAFSDLTGNEADEVLGRSRRFLQRPREPDDRITHFAAMERDIAARTSAELALRKAALQDALTELFNRRGFHHVVARSWASFDEPSGAFCMVDLDRFKAVNDTAGHPVGDLVRSTVGRVRQPTKRETDFAVRLGGAEFAVVLPGASSTQAQVTAEHVRLAVAETVGP